jgi:hypothetical protein
MDLDRSSQHADDSVLRRTIRAFAYREAAIYRRSCYQFHPYTLPPPPNAASTKEFGAEDPRHIQIARKLYSPTSRGKKLKS